MELLFISFLVIFITKVYCKLSEYHPDQIALLILSSGSWNNPYGETEVIGNIVRDINGKPLTVNIKTDGESEEYASIVDIIPSLRNLEPDELKKRFSKLYKLAFATFYNIFEIEREDDIILDDELIKNLINEYDLINALINPEDNSNLLQDIKYDGNLYSSSDIDKDNSLKEIIKSLKSVNLSNIDINQFDDLPDDIKGIWKDDESIPELYKAISIQCAKIEKCINQFQYENEQSLNDISFNIVHYTYNDGNTSNYAFIIINDKSKSVYHAFTLESEGNENFELNKRDSTNNFISYEYINDYYVMNSENVKKRKENEIVVEKGIGLLAECGLIYEDEQYLYEPDYYGYQNDDTDLDDEELKKEIKELNENISQMYDIKEDEGIYNSNMITNIFNFDLVSVNPVEDTENNKISFVKSKSQDDNILCSYTNDQLAHIEELALRFIEVRKYYYSDNTEKKSEVELFLESFNNDYQNEDFSKRDNSSSSNEFEIIELLPFVEQYIINRFYEVIALKKTVKYDGGIFHNGINSELINYNEYLITQNILSNMDTDINSCIGQSDCSVYTLIDVDYDIDSSLRIILSIVNDNYKKKRDLTEELNNIKKLLDPTSENSSGQSFTESLSNNIQNYKLKVENNKIKSEESKKYVQAFKNLVSSLKQDYGKKSKLNSNDIALLDENEITKLETLFKKVGNIHNTKFDDKFRDLRLPTVNIEPNSKYTIDKTYQSFVSCIELINFINGNDNTEPKLNINMNNGEPNISEQYNAMIRDLRNLKIDETLKGQLKQNFIVLLNNANELEKIYDKANKKSFNNGGTYEDNSSMIYNYKDALVEAISVNYGYDPDMKKMIENHKTKVKGIDKLGIKSENKLNFNHIIEKIGKENMEDFIVNNLNSNMYLEPYFDGLKSEIINEVRDNESDKNVEKSICPNSFSKLDSLKSKIEERIKKINEYDSFEGHYDEIIHLVKLMNNFNEAYDTFLKYSDFEYEESENISDEVKAKMDGFKGIYTENYNLESKLRYTKLELQYKIMDKTIKDNPELFKNFKNYDSFKDYIKQQRRNSLEGSKEEFNNNELYYFTVDDVNNLMGGSNSNKYNLKSLSDVMNLVSEKATDKEQLMDMQKSSELTHSLLKHSPSFMRDEDEISEMLSSSQLFDKNKNINANRMNLIESDDQHYERFFNEIKDSYRKLWLKEIISKNNIDLNDITVFDTVQEAYSYVLKTYGPDYKKMGIEIYDLDMEEASVSELKNNPKEFINNIDEIEEGKKITNTYKEFTNYYESELRVNSDRVGEEAHNTLYNRFINILDYDELSKNEKSIKTYNRILNKVNKNHDLKNNYIRGNIYGNNSGHKISGKEFKSENISRLGSNFVNKEIKPIGGNSGKPPHNGGGGNNNKPPHNGGGSGGKKAKK